MPRRSDQRHGHVRPAHDQGRQGRLHRHDRVHGRFLGQSRDGSLFCGQGSGHQPHGELSHLAREVRHRRVGTVPGIHQQQHPQCRGYASRPSGEHGVSRGRESDRHSQVHLRERHGPGRSCHVAQEGHRRRAALHHPLSRRARGSGEALQEDRRLGAPDGSRPRRGEKARRSLQDHRRACHGGGQEGSVQASWVSGSGMPCPNWTGSSPRRCVQWGRRKNSAPSARRWPGPIRSAAPRRLLGSSRHEDATPT